MITERLKKALGVSKVLEGKAIAERYEHIWRMETPLKAKAVLFPTSTEEVSTILKICYAYNQSVTVHGGLTNLVGGTYTHENEIVISTEKLNKIEELDEVSRTITIQSGVILSAVHQATKEKGLFFPLNFGAKGTAQIGGIISTNAGGLRVFRYGMTRDLILGLEVVLADGTIISSLKKIIKDNSAYDLKQLFIGSEGTFGIVTKAVLRLKEAPKSRNSAFVGLSSYKNVVDLLRFMDAGSAGTLSGFELIWSNTFEALTNKYSSVKPPMSYGYKYYVLLETLGSEPEQDKARLMDLLEEAIHKNLIQDAVFAESESDLKWFWTVREDARVLINQCTHVQIFDISLPVPLIEEKIDLIYNNLNELSEVENIFTFGHVADGNIHFLISKTNESEALTHQINTIVYEPLQEIGGSISAEHGIGEDKKKYLPLSKSAEEIALMKLLKQTLDPKGILNQRKIF